jgi:2'-5' RNA ligase
MSGTDSVAGRERVRLFCALTLPDEALDALVRWQRNALRCNARAPGRDQLHVTLAFLGHRFADEVEAVAGALREAVAAQGDPLVLTPLRYRETLSVGMLVLEDEGGKAAALAADLHDRLEALGVYRREARPWLSHVTVLRFRRAPRLRPSLPELGAFSPSGAAVYHSVLRPGGAQYDVLHSVALGG